MARENKFGSSGGTKEAKEEMPTQTLLNQYLIQSPSQMAAITGFVNFLIREYQLNLSPRLNEEKSRDLRRRALEEKIIKIIKNTNESTISENTWIKVSLEYFHDLPKSALKGFTMRNVTLNPDRSFTALIGGKEYWVPPVGKQA